jgi:flavorubredoxin
MQPIDPNQPQRIAPQTYWVGSVLNNTELQCHVYLIENGEHSILIDPGSRLTWPRTKEKIESFLPLNHIRYLVFSHQDPDIAALPESAMEAFHSDVTLVTHSRTSWLLEHYGWQGRYYLVDDHDFKIDIPNDRWNLFLPPICTFPAPSVLTTHNPRSCLPAIFLAH